MQAIGIRPTKIFGRPLRICHCLLAVVAHLYVPLHILVLLLCLAIERVANVHVVYIADDWRADGYRWRQTGSAKPLKSSSIPLQKYYFQVKRLLTSTYSNG